MDDSQSAVRYLTRCLFKWPDCLPALQLRAELYLGVQQNFTKAFLDYQAVLAKADCRGTTMTARRGLADALRGLGELKGSFSSADLSRQVIELQGSVVSSPEPCASSGGRLPEALLMVF